MPQALRPVYFISEMNNWFSSLRLRINAPIPATYYTDGKDGFAVTECANLVTGCANLGGWAAGKIPQGGAS